MDSPTFSLPLPASAAILGIADQRWETWVEKGRAHDRLMRERWLQTATIASVGVVLTAAVVLGLQ